MCLKALSIYIGARRALGKMQLKAADFLVNIWKECDIWYQIEMRYKVDMIDSSRPGCGLPNHQLRLFHRRPQDASLLFHAAACHAPCSMHRLPIQFLEYQIWGLIWYSREICLCPWWTRGRGRRGVALLTGGFDCASVAFGLRTQTHLPVGIVSPTGGWVQVCQPCATKPIGQ